MGKYSDFDAEDVRGKVRLGVLAAGCVIIGLIEWAFGHPTEKEMDLAFGLLLFVIVLEYLESVRQYIVRLNEITKERHEELRKDLIDDLRELDRNTADKLSEIDRAIFDLSLKIED